MWPFKDKILNKSKIEQAIHHKSKQDLNLKKNISQLTFNPFSKPHEPSTTAGEAQIAA